MAAADVAPTIHVRISSASGRGYLGGHNTAAREGWPVSFPEAPKGAIGWWDSTSQGRWTGFEPATTWLEPIQPMAEILSAIEEYRQAVMPAAEYCLGEVDRAEHPEDMSTGWHWARNEAVAAASHLYEEFLLPALEACNKKLAGK